MTIEVNIMCPDCRLRKLQLLVHESSLPQCLRGLLQLKNDQWYYCPNCDGEISKDDYWKRVFVQ